MTKLKYIVPYASILMNKHTYIQKNSTMLIELE